MSLLVHQVAKLSGVSVDTVRRLERLGRISSERDDNGWRRFSPDVVPLIRRAYRKQDGALATLVRKLEPLSTPASKGSV